MRHALFIAFHFPPEASSSGVLRTLKYCRYLESYGWRVTVLTPQTDAYAAVDPRLEAQIPPSAHVVRTRWINTKDCFSFFGAYPALVALPDPWIGWLPWAVGAGRRVLRSDRPDIVYSTSPHATAHLIAYMLARSGAPPWVADFRDPWFEDPPEPGAAGGPVYRWIDRSLERRVIESCTRVVASTDQLRDVLHARYPHSAEGKFVAIPNGYDEADFAGWTRAPAKRSDRMIIVHTGSINAEFRDPRPLFRALRRLADAGSISLDRVTVRFVGGGDFGGSHAIRAALAEADLTQRVEFVARVPFEDALAEVQRADVLLLMQASSDTIHLVPAKLYEYLRAQRPVLALVYPGAASEVLAATRGGWAVDPRDATAVEMGLVAAYRAWETDSLGSHCATLESLRRFDRKTLAGRLADVFAEVA